MAADIQEIRPQSGQKNDAMANDGGGGGANVAMQKVLTMFKDMIGQGGGGEKSSSQKLQCPQVPSRLLLPVMEGTEGCYEPKVMSFGPYHHGKPKLKDGETLKHKLAASYYEDFWVLNDKLSINENCEEISWEIAEMRKCYDDKFTKNYSDEALGLMLVVDGCALLAYILHVCLGYDNYEIKYQDLSRIHQDALLLENQLPSEVLLHLMKKSPFLIETWTVILQEFFSMTDESFFSEFFTIREKSCSKNLMECCCPQFPEIMKFMNRPKTDRNQSKPWCHLLHLYRQNLLGNERSNPTQRELEKTSPKSSSDVKEQVMASFRNVKELMAAGIRIKRSPTSYLRDISFTSNRISACLTLPPIAIDKSTNTMFLNLIAYELSSELPHDFISYLRFLDSLIDHADDVKALQSAGILQNNLGTHEKVAEFFNTVSCNLESNFEAYKDVRVKIRKHFKSHYNNRLKMWITECLDTYFVPHGLS